MLGGLSNGSASLPTSSVAFQSPGQTERVPAGELHLESRLHPRRDGCPTEPVAAATRPPGAWAAGFIQTGLAGITSQTKALRPASAPAGAHPVCRSYHREGGRHHPEHHQADTIQVSFTPVCLVSGRAAGTPIDSFQIVLYPTPPASQALWAPSFIHDLSMQAVLLVRITGWCSLVL